MTRRDASESITVLHVLEAISSGTSRHVVDLVRHVPGLRHHVVIPPSRSTGITDTRAPRELTDAGAVVHVVDMRRLPTHPVNARALGLILGIARRVKPNVMHGHSAIGGALTRCTPLSLPKIYTPHGLMPHPAAHMVERALGHLTSRIVAVSESEREELLRLGIAGGAKVVAIPNGVDLQPLPPQGAIRAQLGVPVEARLVGTVMRVADQKAPEDFISMALAVQSAHPDVHFVLVGQGPQEARIDAAARALGKHYHRIPHIDRVAASVSDLDVFTLLSRYEGGPYVPLEAARAGVPLVLSDATGNRDVVEHGVSGIVVPIGDPQAAAQAVGQVLTDAPRRTAMIQAMTARLHSSFDVVLQAERHLELYHSVIGR